MHASQNMLIYTENAHAHRKCSDTQKILIYKKMRIYTENAQVHIEKTLPTLVKWFQDQESRGRGPPTKDNPQN